jgi:hypothetical protein
MDANRSENFSVYLAARCGFRSLAGVSSWRVGASFHI